jgi:hypothetical protein
MGFRAFLLAFLLTSPLLAQAQANTHCANTPAYTPCEFVFELTQQDASAHPNPYASVDLHIEFRSPRHRTFLMPAFWDGGRRMVVRFTPTEPGQWDYRITSNIAAFNGQQGSFTAAASEDPGFIRAANVHHFAYTEGNRPHLWMGDTCLRFAFLDNAAFARMVDTRVAQKFNHVRGLVLGTGDDVKQAFPSPDQPNPSYFQRLDERIRAMNQKGVVVDLILGGPRDQLSTLMPSWQERERYLRYLIARYAPFKITWQGVQDYETYENGRDLLKEIGQFLQKADPFQHLRSTGAVVTSSALLDDGWMNYVTHHSSDDQVDAIEHQLYPVPFVSNGFAQEASGAGKPVPGAVDADTFRRRLWNATMDGQYIGYANTGTMAADSSSFDPRYLDAPGAKLMSLWHDFMAGTRYWELEPYFDVDGGRALALEGVEYVMYVEKPGPVEVLIEKHGYDIVWFNPATGETVPMKDFKGERFAGEPPDKTHDWILHISREGHKEGMLRSYKFESRRILMQEIEAARVPFDIEQPSGDVSLSQPAPYAAKVKRETRATRSIMYLWTGEVAADSQGFRVLGTGQKGTLQLPPNMARTFPAVLHLRLTGMNANGKVYVADRTYQLAK